MNNQIRDTLLKMYRRIERGWTQHAFARDENGILMPTDHENAPYVCMKCALDLATPDWSIRQATNTLLIQHIRTEHGIQCNSIIGFNDHRDTTKELVLQVLNEAIALVPHHPHCIWCEGKEHHLEPDCDEDHPEPLLRCRHCRYEREMTEAEAEADWDTWEAPER